MSRKTWIGAIALAIAMALTAQPASAGLGDVETPTVFGPQASGPGNTPFMATDIDLTSQGYVEEEYEYSGDAFRYDRTGPTTSPGRRSRPAARSTTASTPTGRG